MSYLHFYGLAPLFRKWDVLASQLMPPPGMYQFNGSPRKLQLRCSFLPFASPTENPLILRI